MLARALNSIGNAMPRWARRFILDRLGGARLLGRMARDSFVEVSLAGGVRLTANPFYHGGVIADGRIAYEDNFTALLSDRVTEGAVFYDLGANIGVFAFLAALGAGPKGVVVAFEPEPNNVACLRRSIARNPGLGRIELQEIAVAAEDGSVTFDRMGGAFSGRIAGGGSSDAESTFTLVVPTRSIDSLVEAGEIPPPTLIKIDIEGGEGAALDGARRTLAAHRPELMIELHHFAPTGVSLTYEVLDALGYRLFAVDGYRAGAGEAGPAPLETAARGKVRHVLALPPEG